MMQRGTAVALKQRGQNRRTKELVGDQGRDATQPVPRALASKGVDLLEQAERLAREHHVVRPRRSQASGHVRGNLTMNQGGHRDTNELVSN
jgi:hypothetical protein